MGVGGHVHRQPAIGGHVHLEPRIPQQFQRYLLVHRVILHQEYPGTGVPAADAVLGRGARAGRVGVR